MSDEETMVLSGFIAELERQRGCARLIPSPICARCDKRVDRVAIVHLPLSGHFCFQLHCHGQVQRTQNQDETMLLHSSPSARFRWEGKAFDIAPCHLSTSK